MSVNFHLESPFEKYISKKVAGMADNGWVISPDDTGFSPDTALYMPDFVDYVKATAPEKVEKMQKQFGSNWESNLEKKLVHSLEVDGTVNTLRNGFSMAGYQTIVCSGHYPDDPRVKSVKAFYDANILRVMHQVHYQTAGKKSLDLVFFINGIPVATAEVKTEFTQTVENAIFEYQTERKPIEPGTNRKNYLLMFRRGAVVHFAVSEKEIWMCTNLEPKVPKFLPFNKGCDGHAGNPVSEDANEYPTGYFWNELLQRDNWLRIFHNFIFVKEERKEDITGRIRTVTTQLFPRYHQWDCVVKCIDDVKANGVGQRYLVEHSAGSGKSETLSWIAHELIRLRDEQGNAKFNSVIVVTDRIGLDTNIKNTITQLKKTVGLIATIGGDGKHKKTSASKSKELAEAFHEKREIIVVTLQTFPFALEAIAQDKDLEGANFAVLIDEAHNAQEGIYSRKMKAALKLAAKAKKKEEVFGADASEVTDEELLNEYFKMEQAAGTMPENVSFFAFTATPKAETKTIFGRPGNRTDAKTGEAIPESFHTYPMRQAIEEGYIIDVLRGYMPYNTAYRLKEDVCKETLVDKNRAIRTIAQWANLHPTNVMSKAQFIIEHFVKNVSSLLDGQAKAMIVTASRPAVIRYKYAIDAYLRAHPEYDRSKIEPHLQFKVPGEPLVAFSGSISGEKCIMPEDMEITEAEYLKDNPFAHIKRDYDYTEDNMNNIGSETIEHAFDRTESRLLIVANKFQVGFNQPKLCALYIDKKISNDIEIVQTYSRLNRIFPGKDTVYIMDFANDEKIVMNAFQKYDKGAVMEKAQNLDIIYDIKKDLDNAYVYTAEEFETFKKTLYKCMTIIDEGKKDNYRIQLYNVLNKPASRWIDKMKALQTSFKVWAEVREQYLHDESDAGKEMLKRAEEELNTISENMNELNDFNRKLRKYISAYSYISQIIDFGEPDLEVFFSFAKLLSKRLKGLSPEDIDMKNLVLADYKLHAVERKMPEEAGSNAVLRPMSAGGKTEGMKQKSIREIVKKFNENCLAKMTEVWGSDISPETGAKAVNLFTEYVNEDDVSRIQIQNTSNSKTAIIESGRMENIIKEAAIRLKTDDFAKLADKILSDPQSWKPLAEIIYDLIKDKERLDILAIKDIAKKK